MISVSLIWTLGTSQKDPTYWLTSSVIQQGLFQSGGTLNRPGGGVCKTPPGSEQLVSMQHGAVSRPVALTTHSLLFISARCREGHDAVS